MAVVNSDKIEKQMKSSQNQTKAKPNKLLKSRSEVN